LKTIEKVFEFIAKTAKSIVIAATVYYFVVLAFWGHDWRMSILPMAACGLCLLSFTVVRNEGLVSSDDFVSCAPFFFACYLLELIFIPAVAWSVIPAGFIIAWIYKRMCAFEAIKKEENTKMLFPPGVHN